MEMYARAKQKLGKEFLKVRLVCGYIMNSLINNIKRLSGNENQVIFSLEDDMLFKSDDGSGRHAYNLLRMFSKMGYNVYLYKHVTARGYKHLGVFGRFIFSIENLKIINHIPKNTEDIIFAFDVADPILIKRKWKKLIYVNVLKPTEFCYGNALWVPFDLFPWMYRYKQDRRIPEFRKFSKTLRIFFGGNTAKEYYENTNIKRYGQLTRREGINALLGKVDGVEAIRDVNQFLRDIESGEPINKCLLLQTEEVPRIHRKKWLEVVTRSEFFLCLSGTDYPMCHNAIEAIALGVIPILSYADWFYPPLEHMKNAIIYSGPDDLAEKVKEVLNLPNEKIEAMRKNIIHYYDQNMTPDRVKKHLESDPGNICTLMLYPNLIMTPDEEREVSGFRKGLQDVLGPFSHCGKGANDERF